MARIRQVQQDDGRTVPFRERRIVEAVASALRSAGEDDRSMAEELSGVVVLFLEKYHGESVPHVRDVAQMVIRVLDETGHSAAARAYEALQKRSVRLEGELVIRGGRSREPECDRPFSRSLLVERTKARYEMPTVIAEEVAAAVERQIIRLGNSSIGWRLIDALIEEDLRERGLGQESPGDHSVRFPRQRIEAWMREDGEGALGTRIAEEVLEEYSLFDLHGADVSLAHRQSRIHVHGLGAPLRLERLVLDAGLLGLGEHKGGGLARELLRLRREIDALRVHVRGDLVLPDLLGWLSQIEPLGVEPMAAVDLLLDALADDAGTDGATLLLFVPLVPDAPPVLASALRRFFGGSSLPRGIVPVLAVDPGLGVPDGAETDDLIRRAALHGPAIIEIRRAGDPPLLPVPGRPPRTLRTSIGRVALNLPILLLEQEAPDLQASLAATEPALRLALRALSERFWLQRSGPKEGIHAVAERLGGPGRVQIEAEGQEADIEVWGLPVILDLLEARRVIRASERIDVATRILAFIDYVAGDDHEGVRFRVRLGALRDLPARQRFLEATREAIQRTGDRHAKACLVAAGEAHTMLPVSVPLFSARNAPLADAPFVERLGQGLALPLLALGEGAPSALLSRLAKETRFGLLSLLAPRPEECLIEVQEELF